MHDKKQKNSKQQEESGQIGESNVFEVHTMHSDSEVGKNQSQKTEAPSGLPVAEKSPLQTKPTTQESPITHKQDKKQPVQQEQNPFLTMDKENSDKKTEIKKGSFAPGKQKEPVEKFNQSPADIAPQKKQLPKKAKNPQKKVMRVVMIVFIIVFLLGIVGFGVYMLRFNNQPRLDDIQVPDQELVDLPIENVEDDTNTMEVYDGTDPVESTEQLYAIDLPNYFSIDVESMTSEDEIATEFATIAQNMQDQDIVGPISFIVTDTNNSPVSFHVFAVSAGMDLPQDVLTLLEEGFEIYVYNSVNGIRFGFVVDAKNADLLQVALHDNETMLPKSFDLILNGLGVSATNIVFNDSTYGTHPIRYYNLNEEETYSVDYTINDRRLVLGSTKDTLRAMIDYSKDAQVPKNNNTDF